MTAKFRIYGITGGIASGKSTAASYFRELGIPVVDADEIARDLRAPGGGANDLILARFGTLDRFGLRKSIATDPLAKRDLEKILHPLIAEESARRFSALAQASKTSAAPPYALYEAALLVEAGRASEFAGVILVEGDRTQQLARLVNRDMMDPESARLFLDAQASVEAKRKGCTHFLKNEGTLDDLKAKVMQLHLALLRGETHFVE